MKKKIRFDKISLGEVSLHYIILYLSSADKKTLLTHDFITVFPKRYDDWECRLCRDGPRSTFLSLTIKNWMSKHTCVTQFVIQEAPYAQYPFFRVSTLNLNSINKTVTIYILWSNTGLSKQHCSKPCQTDDYLTGYERLLPAQENSPLRFIGHLSGEWKIHM